MREDWENDEEGRLEQVLTNLNESCKGFRPFERHGEYLYSSTTEAEPLGTDHIGSFRVRFEYSLCGEVSLMAQQIYNPTDSVWTFRKWNPLKKGLPYGEDTSEKDAKNCMCLRSFFCLCCVIVGWCMDSMAEEVVFMIEEEKTSGQEYLKKQDVEVRTMGCGLRPTGILLSVFGWFLLFLPSIEFFKWIPLIGHMMSWTFFVIALVVGLLVGGSLAVLVLAVAWLRFNPLWGIILLSLTGIGVACIFILPTYF